MIPTGLPTISRGSHVEGSGEACVMEYVALLAGEPWCDMPKCTNKYLANAAIYVNDTISDDNRGSLINLIGRLFGTDENLSHEQTSVLVELYNQFTGCGVDGDFEKIALLERMLDAYDILVGRTDSGVTQDQILELGPRLEAMASGG